MGVNSNQEEMYPGHFYQPEEIKNMVVEEEKEIGGSGVCVETMKKERAEVSWPGKNESNCMRGGFLNLFISASRARNSVQHIGSR